MHRTHWIMAALAGLVLFLGIRWLLAPPTITVNFVDAPLHQVLAAIEKQGRVTLRTSLDADTPVTLNVRRAPVMEALDLLAVRADGALRWAYVLGPDRQTVREGVELLVASREQREGWRSFQVPMDQWIDSIEPPDPRRFRWEVEAMPAGNLEGYLSQGSQKLPLQIFTPAVMLDTAVSKPVSGPASRVMKALARSVDGEAREVFVLTGGWGGRSEGRTPGAGTAGGESTRWNRESGGDGGGNRGGGMAGAPNGGGDRGASINPAWIEERTQQLIAALPVEEREPAREQVETMRSLREQFAGLEGEARREAMREFFSQPAVQERFEENMAVRDAKRTPEQREARYRRTAERRLEAREAAGNPLVARP